MIKEENLMGRNYVLLLDKSGSMGEAVKSGSSQSRWSAAKEMTLALARKCIELDPDGIDVYTFNKSFKKYTNVNPDTVNNIFKEEPCGGTDFVPVLKEVLKDHFSKDIPTTILVVTDGEPSDGLSGQKALANLIIEASNKLEGDSELGISFIQVGTDPAAQTFLKKLDDDLQSAGAKFDIVDTKTMDDLENMSITDVLLSAIND